MTENRKTIWMGGIAAALLLVAWTTTPRTGTPAVLADRGQLLFPQFQDPNSAASLEVVEYDAKNAAVHPLKIQNRNGRWTIPSQHDYPADAKNQLARVAAAIIGLKKDDFVSDSANDYERCGVLDPLDASSPSLNGRGTRLTVRGANDQLLADVIIGNNVEGHPGFRYTRVPSQRRVYTSNIGNLNVSTDFGDWIERDLLEVNAEDIDAVNLRNYSLDRTTGRVDPGETMLLQKPANGDWNLNGLNAGERLNFDALDGLLKNLASLRITSVLPKPPGITAMLSRAASDVTVTNDDRADLARKGFYFAGPQLVSDRGEVVVRTNRGVFYTLRFGDIAPETDSAAAAPEKGTHENRYLFIMVDFDAKSAATPGRASEGNERVQFLRTRFAPWYYVIAADSFAKIRLQRKDLVKSAGGRS
jgi:hypothetical protein